MAYTTANLLTEIKQRAAAPASQETYTDSSFLRLATNELLVHVVPMLVSTREEYLIREMDYSISGSTSYVVLPDRAIGGAARDVFYVDANGNSSSVGYIDSEQRDRVNSGGFVRNFMVYFKWDHLVLVGQVPSGTLRVPYYCRPGELVETTDAGKITAINTSTGELTLDAVPSDFTTSLTYDLISAKGTYQYHSIDLTPSAVGASSVTFTPADLPSDLAVNDYVAVAGESPLPQLPREFQPILAQRVVVKVLESQGDHAALDRAKADLEEMEKSAMKLVQPRLQGEPKKIVSGMNSRRWMY